MERRSAAPSEGDEWGGAGSSRNTAEPEKPCRCCAGADCETSFVIRHLRTRVSALQEENDYLRASANTFADLADRLRHRLREALGR